MPNITGANEFIDIAPVPARIGGVLSVANVVSATGHSLMGAEFLSDACATPNEVLDFCAIDPTIGQCVPPPPVDPAITTLAPNTVAASAGPTLITVTGTNFVSGSVIEIDQVAQPTTFVSATTLTTNYDPTVAGSPVFTVRNPNEEESNSVTFTVTAAAAQAFDPGDHTIPEVEAYIEEHPNQLKRVLKAEQKGQARVTLLAWLEARDD
jgi:hypothetical protein